MTTLLHIDASARTDRSISRHLSALFMSAWRDENPGDRVMRRDLAVTPPGFVTADWIAACFTPEDRRSLQMQESLRESDTLIDEIEAADLVVLGTPMAALYVDEGPGCHRHTGTGVGRFGLQRRDGRSKAEAAQR